MANLVANRDWLIVTGLHAMACTVTGQANVLGAYRSYRSPCSHYDVIRY